jgi:hypothetical protein
VSCSPVYSNSVNQAEVLLSLWPNVATSQYHRTQVHVERSEPLHGFTCKDNPHKTEYYRHRIMAAWLYLSKKIQNTKQQESDVKVNTADSSGTCTSRKISPIKKSQ